MTTKTIIPFEDRVEKAAKILTIDKKTFTKELKDNGVDGIEILDASTTSIDDLKGIITFSHINNTKSKGALPLLKVNAAAAILKGEDPFAKPAPRVETPKAISGTSELADLIKSQRPITQWSDEEVLNKYLLNDGEEEERELQKRAKNHRFIILQDGSNEEVDVPASLAMLKRARKEDVPASLKTTGGKFIRIFKVEEYHVRNRIRFESPLRPGVVLFDGYCQVSKQNFNNVCEEERMMLRLIHEEIGEQSRTDENKLVKLAEQGMDFLLDEYGDIYFRYKELELAGKLPNLKIVAPLETKADPFKPGSGHITY